MVDDKQSRICAIVPNLMGCDSESLPTTYHAFHALMEFNYALSADESLRISELRQGVLQDRQMVRSVSTGVMK